MESEVRDHSLSGGRDRVSLKWEVTGRQSRKKEGIPCEQRSSPRLESELQRVRSRVTLSEFRDKATEESKVRMGPCQEA